MIRNRSELATTAQREVALDCVSAGIEAAQPVSIVHNSVRVSSEGLVVTPVGDDPISYDVPEATTFVLLGGGKAAAGVAAALEDILGDRLSDGVVVTDTPAPTRRVTVIEGDHPIPSERNVEATAHLLERARAVESDTVVLFVLTGGASALLSAPASGIELHDLQRTTDELLDSGATIHEINAVRKHLSGIKGGRLAAAVAPATVLTLAISDVVGDDLSVIGSGPTVPDPSTYQDAVAVLERYDVSVPNAVRERLEDGVAGRLEETPKADDPALRHSSANVIANGYTALEGARSVVPEEYAVCVLSSRFEGEARELADTHLAIGAEVAATGNPVPPPAVLLSGGEATVTVRGDGEGGPSQELALATALGVEEIPGVGDGSAARKVTAAVVDTDGRDGATEAAGALVDTQTVAGDQVEPARRALERNDSTPFLAERNALIRTGRTGTNVNDLRAYVIGNSDG